MIASLVGLRIFAAGTMDASSTSLLVAATWLEKHQALIALYGAGVATLVAAWNVYRAITNRGRLRVRVSRAVVAEGGDVEEGKLWFQVTNVGRQPIWLKQIGGAYRRPRMDLVIVVPQQFPMKLDPGQVFSDASSDVVGLDQARLKYLGAWDTVDKIHKAPRRQVRELFGE